MRLLWLLLLLPAVQGALNQPEAYDFDTQFDDSLDGVPTLYSGKADGTHNLQGAVGILEATAVLTGFDEVCWGVGQCLQDVTATISGSIGMRSPNGILIDWQASHALAFFVSDADALESNANYDIGPSMYGFMLSGEATWNFQQTPSVGAIFSQDDQAGMMPLDSQTTIQLQGSDGVYTHQGEGDPLVFSGQPSGTSEMNGLVMPVQPGIHFTPAAQSDADAALDPDRIDRLLQTLGAGADLEQLRQLEGTLSGILNGAVLSPDNLTLIRFEDLRLEAAGDSLSWQSSANLVIQEGSVENGASLVGVKYFALPWWSIVLWALAVGLLVTRLVMKPEKVHEKWDRYKWIGNLATFAMFVLTFILWDFEMRAVWGSSLLSKPNGAIGLAITALMQLATYSLVMFAVAVPIRVAIRNGLLIGKQGTFMNLAAPVATLIGFLAGAHLLSAYLDFFLAQVMDNLANS